MTTAPTYAEGVAATRRGAQTTALGVLMAVSASHMLNDVMQSLAPALYPVFREKMALSFFQTGVITFVFQSTASLLQPFIGLVTDRRPINALLPAGMAFTLIGLIGLAFADTYPLLLVAVALIGVGSAIFHPEASRVARAASGGRHGFAQSLFQVGGNFGQSTGPLLAAFVVVPFGQRSVLAFTAFALTAVVLLTAVSRWFAAHRAKPKIVDSPPRATLPRAVVLRTLAVLIIMLFSKVLYLASIGSYYTFYLMETFGVSLQTSQMMLFVFLASVAAGTFLGGPIADRIGAQIRHLGLDPRRPAVHAAPAASWPRRHGDQLDCDRAHHLLRLFGDRRLCAGADAGQRRRGRGPLLRPLVRLRRASARRCWGRSPTARA